MEIEKKYLINEKYPLKEKEKYKHCHIEQAYISTKPVIRIRRMDEIFFLTIKSKGHIQREEYEIEISKEEYAHLSTKVEGGIIKKTRYYIPYNNFTVEYDVFEDQLFPLETIEVEFKSMEEANSFIPPNWFGKDITFDPNYKNSHLATAINSLE